MPTSMVRSALSTEPSRATSSAGTTSPEETGGGGGAGAARRLRVAGARSEGSTRAMYGGPRLPDDFDRRDRSERQRPPETAARAAGHELVVGPIDELRGDLDVGPRSTDRDAVARLG